MFHPQRRQQTSPKEIGAEQFELPSHEVPTMFAFRATGLLSLLLATLAACQSGNSSAPFDDPGATHRPLRVDSEVAQRSFDQGLLLMWGFNHDEAIESFKEAARLAPESPMPWWAIALANGPHINNPALEPDRARAAWEALAQARARESQATPLERDLIRALGARYSADFAAERGPLDQAYADAMVAIWRAHPSDADVGTWCAEALMDLHPWDLWTVDHRAKKGALEVVAVLEQVLALAPDHPGACHLYIHALEASPYPERALPAAERLGARVVDTGHLLHMPAHIDARLGRWAEAADANRRAIAADERHAERFPRAGFYRLYMAHNHHFLAWASMMLGDRAGALSAAREMHAGVPREFVDQMGPFVDGFMPVVLHVQVRFGLWDDILATPPFPAELKISNCVRHYSRGVALVVRGDLVGAEGELRAFDDLAATIEESRPIGNNPANTVLKIPRALLEGELRFRRGEIEPALASLREAVRMQSQLRYDEAPDWMMPSRHALGAALLEARQFEEAKQVFLADLEEYPRNGWSLFGLGRAHEGLGEAAQAKTTGEEFTRAWSRADVRLSSPCYCQPGR